MARRYLNVARWAILLLSPLAGVGACWIPTHPSPRHVAWGWPFPQVIFEQTDAGWRDYPGPAALLLNPLAFTLFGWGLFLIIRRLDRRRREIAS